MKLTNLEIINFKNWIKQLQNQIPAWRAPARVICIKSILTIKKMARVLRRNAKRAATNKRRTALPIVAVNNIQNHEELS